MDIVLTIIVIFGAIFATYLVYKEIDSKMAIYYGIYSTLIVIVFLIGLIST